MSRIDEISSKSRAKILAALENAYKKSDFKAEQSIDPIMHIIKNGDELSELKQKMNDNKYIVEEANEENLEEKINEISASYGYESLIYPANLGLNLDKIKASKKVCFDKEIEHLRSEVFSSDFSVIKAKAGISSHGIVLVLSSKQQPRMLSLAPKLCIILLKKEDVVKSISDALNLVKSQNEILPTNILFIAGPSRTADIELITIFGVHGPQNVHVILY